MKSLSQVRSVHPAQAIVTAAFIGLIACGGLGSGSGSKASPSRSTRPSSRPLAAHPSVELLLLSREQLQLKAKEVATLSTIETELRTANWLLQDAAARLKGEVTSRGGQLSLRGSTRGGARGRRSGRGGSGRNAPARRVRLSPEEISELRDLRQKVVRNNKIALARALRPMNEHQRERARQLLDTYGHDIPPIALANAPYEKSPKAKLNPQGKVQSDETAQCMARQLEMKGAQKRKLLRLYKSRQGPDDKQKTFDELLSHEQRLKVADAVEQCE